MKAAQEKIAFASTSRVAADQSVPLDALQEDVPVLKTTEKWCQAKV